MSIAFKICLYSLASSEEKDLFQFAAHWQIILIKLSSVDSFLFNFK